MRSHVRFSEYTVVDISQSPQILQVGTRSIWTGSHAFFHHLPFRAEIGMPFLIQTAVNIRVLLNAEAASVIRETGSVPCAISTTQS